MIRLSIIALGEGETESLSYMLFLGKSLLLFEIIITFRFHRNYNKLLPP